MEQLERITQKPQVMGGKACIRGMRVTVGMIVGQMATGTSIDEILADYPYLGAKIFFSHCEAVHWSSVGLNNAPDAEIMSYPFKSDCVVLTHDLDFGAILAATRGEKPSVVQIRADDVRALVMSEQVISVLRQMWLEVETGALITVTPKRSKLRLLPLKLRD